MYHVGLLKPWTGLKYLYCCPITVSSLRTFQQLPTLFFSDLLATPSLGTTNYDLPRLLNVRWGINNKASNVCYL